MLFKTYFFKLFSLIAILFDEEDLKKCEDFFLTSIFQSGASLTAGKKVTFWGTIYESFNFNTNKALIVLNLVLW